MKDYVYCECGHCGWLGKITELQEHPTRPMPMDLGFCPECEAEIDYLLTHQEYQDLLDSYND